MPIRVELLQQNGSAHDGVLSYAVDNALAFAGGSVLDLGVQDQLGQLENPLLCLVGVRSSPSSRLSLGSMGDATLGGLIRW